jgi:deoxyribose-phosphate aldolase
MKNQELIDRITNEVMKIYNVQPSSEQKRSLPAPEIKTFPGTVINKAPLPADSHSLKALVLISGNEKLSTETISRFRELRNQYRQVKVLLSDNARNIFQKQAARPFAGFEWLAQENDLEEVHVFDHFHILNPTVNTLSKMASLQADNGVSLLAKRALLWGKPVYISLDEIPSYPPAMMDEFNLIIEKLTRFGYIWTSGAAPESTRKFSMPGAAMPEITPVLPAFKGKDSDLAAYIDHTLLKAEADQAEVERLCQEASQYGFFSVCVNPMWVSLCSRLLKSSNVKVCTVIGFPLGATTSATKAFETREAIQNGADEIDMVMNIGKMKSRDFDFVKADIKAVVDAAAGTLVKVILETALLSREEIIIACRLSKEAGAHFVKTSTGFSKAGATVEHIKLMRTAVGPEMGVKASGGVRNTANARELIAAGANRIGASASIAICTGKDAGKGKY